MVASPDGLKWADIETMLQLTAALNLAFYTFKEIRLPGVAGTNAKIEELLQAARDLQSEIETYQDKIKINFEKQSNLAKIEIGIKRTELILLKAKLIIEIKEDIRKLKTDFDDYLQKRLSFEPIAGEFAFFVSIFSMIALLFASLWPRQDINFVAALFMLVVGLSPVFVFLRMNYRIFGGTKNYQKRADEITKRINVISMEARMLLDNIEKQTKEDAP